jgi:hypothetical protein
MDEAILRTLGDGVGDVNSMNLLANMREIAGTDHGDELVEHVGDGRAGRMERREWIW